MTMSESQTIVFATDAVVRYGVMITGAQIRAARALLGWSAAQLAGKSGISYTTIQRAESIDGISSMRATNPYALQRALEDGGIIFVGPVITGAVAKGSG